MILPVMTIINILIVGVQMMIYQPTLPPISLRVDMKTEVENL